MFCSLRNSHGTITLADGSLRNLLTLCFLDVGAKLFIGNLDHASISLGDNGNFTLTYWYVRQLQSLIRFGFYKMWINRFFVIRSNPQVESFN